MSVVLCSLNGEEGVARCLTALQGQTVRGTLEIIVVDDGSSDRTASVAEQFGAIVLRHRVNRGLSAARNTGIQSTTQPVVAFLDDDCVPADDWAARILAGYESEDIVGVGGYVADINSETGVMIEYLRRYGPIRPIAGRRRRLGWSPGDAPGAGVAAGEPIDAWALVGANMSFRRDVLLAVDGFDPRFRFGADEVDLAYRIHLAFPHARLVVDPAARVSHLFDATVSELIGRARNYGIGTARMHAKWKQRIPRLYPRPIAAVVVVAASVRRRRLTALLPMLPPLLLLDSVSEAIGTRQPGVLLHGYIKFLEDTASAVGYVQGRLRFRGVDWEDGTQARALAS